MILCIFGGVRVSVPWRPGRLVVGCTSQLGGGGKLEMEYSTKKTEG